MQRTCAGERRERAQARSSSTCAAHCPATLAARSKHDGKTREKKKKKNSGRSGGKYCHIVTVDDVGKME